MIGTSTKQRRSRRLLHLFMLVALIATLVDWSTVIVAAQDDLGTPAAETTISETPTSEPTEVPTEAVTEVPTEVATETATAEPTEAPPIFVSETPTVKATESTTATATQTPTPAMTGIGAAADAPQSATIHVIATSGTADGPRLSGVCFNVTNPSYGFPEGFGCTDANGEVTIQTASSFTGSKGFNIHITTPAGYQVIDSLLRFLIAGQVNEVPVTFIPLAPVTETLKAIDSSTGNPVAGACWNYYENLNHGTPGNLAIGPKCDDDNDGTVTVTDIPWAAYCVIVTPPTGYTLVGASTICTEAAQRPTNITKAFSISEVTGNGSANLTFRAPWGAPVEGVCGQVSLIVSGNPFSVASACSDANGQATISDLLDGSYTLTGLTWPNFWDRFSEASFIVTGGNTAALDITVNPRTAGNATLITVFVNGPTRLGGSCWTVANGLDIAASGYYEVAAPVCDTDGDGTVVLTDVPSGPYCFLLTPPAGYYRSDGQRGFCVNESNGQGFTLTVGVSQIPVTPTTTPTTPTSTPTPTTPVPTPTPVPNEPNGNIAVFNCADDHRVFPDGEPHYQLCFPVAAGVRFAVFQNGMQITTVTTGADGTVPLILPARTPYVLQYLDGNLSPYIPALNQSTMLRYDSSQRFLFVRDPASDHTWTFTATMRGYNDGFTAMTPLGGACAKVVGQDDVEYLPEVCDTDNDGVIVVGQLAPRYDNLGNIFYRMVMTQPPTGYEIRPLGGSNFDANHPNDITATVNYSTNTLRIHVVDGNGDPVLGYCLLGDGTIHSGGVHCDGPSPYVPDDALDGVISFAGLVPGVNHTFESYPTTPGWTPDTNVATFTTTSGVFTDVIYRVHPYGSAAANQADVHVTLAHKDLGPGYAYNDRGLADICYRISGFIGNPAGGACSSSSGEILIRNVPQGSYSLVLNRNNSLCASVPSSKAFAVGAGDLGGTVEVNIEVNDCFYRVGGKTCTVEATAQGRTVDLYYGTLTGAGGGTLLSTVQLSESIPVILSGSLLGAENPDPAHITSAALANWTEPYYDGSGGTDWSRRPDWDGNAYQLMLNAYGGVTGDYSLGAKTSRGSYQLQSGVGFSFEWTDGNTDWSLYPECSRDSDEIWIFITYESTVNLYELNATENTPVTATPTPIPSPAPMCTTTVTRDLTLYYGEVFGVPYVAKRMALSDYIPPALSAAIAAGNAPSDVRTNISAWIGTGLENETWAESTPNGYNAESDLRSQLENSGATVGDPLDHGTTEYTYSNYRYLDITDLPAGCSPDLPDDEIQPAFSILIPVTQTTVVRVHTYEMNATVEGSPSPTATVTATATSTPTAEPTSAPATTTSVAPTSTTSPTDIRGLPNTGASPESGDSTWLAFALALLLAFTGLFVLTTRRQKR
ncbi:hypothetical protein BH09CHL1_BH09CHL1_04900 [soil metagenome]